MKRRILAAAVLALVFAFAMPPGGAAAATGTGAVGGHYSEAMCNYVPATVDSWGNIITPRQDYVAVWGSMLASPVTPPAGVFVIGSLHMQQVRKQEFLFKLNSMTGAWEYQTHGPLWGTTVGDSAWNVNPSALSFSAWTNYSTEPGLDAAHYPYHFTRFNIAKTGDYRVAVKYYWLQDAQAASGYDYRWADIYTDLQYQNPPTDRCRFVDHTPTVIKIGG